jgi:hypothetical protein
LEDTVKKAGFDRENTVAFALPKAEF